MLAAPQSGSPIAWKPLVVCPHRAIGSGVMNALEQVLPGPHVVLAEYPRPGKIAGMAADRGANLCFLDVVTAAEQAEGLISEIVPSVPVVALMAEKDADQMLRCLRRGATEFLTEFSPASLRGVLDHLSRARHPAEYQSSGQIWCTIPGKPGSGASTLAVHLAVEARAGAGPVLLVDTDFLAGSIGFILKLKPEFHLGDVVRDWKRMDQDLWTKLTVPTCGIDVLAAAEDPAIRLELGRQQVAELCAFWRERYRTVILDFAGPQFALESGFAAMADSVLVVTTNELAALQTTRRTLRWLDKGKASKTRLLLNRYAPSTGLKREDIQKALGIQPFATICNDYETVQTVLLEGRPAPANSRFAVAVRAVCAQLQDRVLPAKKPTFSLTSLFKRP